MSKSKSKASVKSIHETQKIGPASRSDSALYEHKRKIRRLKKKVYAELFRELPFSRLMLSDEDSEVSRNERLYVVNRIKALLRDVRMPAGVTLGDLVSELLEGLILFGPLVESLVDDDITEIMVNNFDQIFVEKLGKLLFTNARFLSVNHLLTCIDRILRPLGKSVNARHPMVDSRLSDGSRINVIIPPLAVQGPMITIRKFVRPFITAGDLMRMGTMTNQMARFLDIAVKARRNIVISGGTASGKTTLCNVLSASIPEGERIITIEDAAELQLFQFHVGRLETRPPGIEGEGAVSIGELFRNSLRMRPDRIIVGECRGPEALDMLQAMNSGHEGSITTIHANSPRDAIARLETMAMMAGSGLDPRGVRKQIASAIDLVISMSRHPDGSRKIGMITELTGMEGDTITQLDLFRFRQTGVSEDGITDGVFEPTGAIPRFYEQIRGMGLNPPMDIFS